MSLSPNMTEDKLKALLDALPDEMDEGELCATTLTIYSIFMDDPAQIISELIATIYTLGQTSGMSRKDISFVLRASADAYDAVHRTQTKH
jgi:hypothetical protein